MSVILREHAEQQFAEELDVLKQQDERPRPPNWNMSPWAVATYLLGGTLADGFSVTAKYIGQRRLVAMPADGGGVDDQRRFRQPRA